MSSPHEIGLAWEKKFASLMGGEPTPASGALWFAKMDVGGKEILWSCKATEKESFSLRRGQIDEVVDAVQAPGGKGGDYIPGMAISIGDGAEELVVMRVSDFSRLVAEERKLFSEDVSATRRRAADLPEIFRI